MTVDELIIRASTDATSVTPSEAGWDRVSFRVDSVAAGERLDQVAGEFELALVPLSGRAEIEADGRTWAVGGRSQPFTGLPQALYLPRDATYSVSAVEGPLEIATCGARTDHRNEPRLVTERDYEVELRGAGNASRQVVTLIPPEFPADRLLVVEVWTPAGNWSSYPPHKHDQSDPPDEIVLEETYYFRVNPPHGFAVQSLYSPSRGVDRSWLVGDGDLLMVPWGYHTTAAAPGYDLYYLNVLAGEARALTAREDPEHAWVRQRLTDEEMDPRLPLVS